MRIILTLFACLLNFPRDIVAFEFRPHDEQVQTTEKVPSSPPTARDRQALRGDLLVFEKQRDELIAQLEQAVVDKKFSLAAELQKRVEDANAKVEQIKMEIKEAVSTHMMTGRGVHRTAQERCFKKLKSFVDASRLAVTIAESIVKSIIADAANKGVDNLGFYSVHNNYYQSFVGQQCGPSSSSVDQGDPVIIAHVGKITSCSSSTETAAKACYLISSACRGRSNSALHSSTTLKAAKDEDEFTFEDFSDKDIALAAGALNSRAKMAMVIWNLWKQGYCADVEDAKIYGISFIMIHVRIICDYSADEFPTKDEGTILESMPINAVVRDSNSSKPYYFFNHMMEYGNIMCDKGDGITIRRD